MQIQIKNATKNIIVSWEQFTHHATLSISHLSSRYDYYTQQITENEFRIQLNADEDDAVSFHRGDTTRINIILIPDKIEERQFNFINSYYNRDKETETFLFLTNPVNPMGFPVINKITCTNDADLKISESWRKDNVIFFDMEM